jgi:thiosulfate dehydrogenase [quinone] large subunit
MSSSDVTRTTDFRLAYGLLRMILGTNIAVHGLSRLIAGVKPFAQGLLPLFANTHLPPRAVYAYGIALPFAETAIGLCVLLGFESRYAFVWGLLLILSLTLGATFRQDWESAGLQLIYALAYALLLACREYNTFSIDGWWAGFAGKG